jgi:hypothetical protein
VAAQQRENVAARHVRVREIGIQPERFLAGRERFRAQRRVLRPGREQPLQQVHVGVRQPRSGLRERRVQRHRALEHLPRQLDVLHGKRAEVLAAAEVHLVGARIGSTGAAKSLGFVRRHAQAQRGHHRARDLLLDGEGVLLGAVESVGPELVSVAAHQPRADAQTVLRLAHAALQDRGDAQGPGHGADVGRLPLELERGAARGHAQALHGAERVDDLLRDAVAHPVLILGRAEVGKRQDRDAPQLGGDHRGATRLPRVPAQPRSGERQPDRDQEDQQTGARGRARALDVASFQIEHPGEDQRDGKPDAERGERGWQHPFRQAQPVHHGFDDLEHRERRHPVCDDGAEHAPALHFLQPGHRVHARDDNAPGPPDVRSAKRCRHAPARRAGPSRPQREGCRDVGRCRSSQM